MCCVYLAPHLIVLLLHLPLLYLLLCFETNFLLFMMVWNFDVNRYHHLLIFNVFTPQLRFDIIIAE
jgi:hypothetical protein